VLRPTLLRIGSVACAVASLVLATAVAGAAGGVSAAPKATKGPAQVVVRIDQADGYTLSDVEAHYPVQQVGSLLGTRGIYLVESTSNKYTTDPGSTQDLANQISHSHAVIYAEPNYTTSLDDSQFHAWPVGSPSGDGSRHRSWADQPAAKALDLSAVQQRATGAGTTIAILDTGADPEQPALRGHLSPGWNYVEDNSNTGDVADYPGNGRYANDALGHGTFVSGLALLVAPQATILPERVLDSNGQGNIFVVAQAIIDATNAGANVINLSLGTATPIPSHLLGDAIHYAAQRGVALVAAAGNDGDDKPHFPAATPGVTSVGALDYDSGFARLASFSDFGGWVAVAAPGTRVAGPLPGGRFGWWRGTSMASPFVAGEAALIRSAYPTLKSNDITDAIDHSARHMDKTQIGHGRIDILAALDAAAAKTPPPPKR
jgi:thermitase